MSVELTMIIEKFNKATSRWEAVYGDKEEVIMNSKKELEELKKDETKHVKAIFNGRIEQLEALIQDSTNTVHWIVPHTSPLTFEYLAGIKLAGQPYFVPAFKNGGTEDLIALEVSPEASKLTDNNLYHTQVIYTEKELSEAVRKLKKIKRKIGKFVFTSISEYLDEFFVAPLAKTKRSVNEEFRFILAFKG